MLTKNQTTFTVEDLQLTEAAQNDPYALIAQSFLAEVLANPHLGHNTSRFKSLLLSLYNSTTYPLDVQNLGPLIPELSDKAFELMTECVKSQKEPHGYFINGPVLFGVILPNWGTARKVGASPDFDQQQFLRNALQTLKLTREQLSVTLGCSKRGLDKWLLPTKSQDFRPMGAAYVNQVKFLLRMGPVAQGNLLPENGVLAMGLACKAFALLGRESFAVSAALSIENPEGLQDFGDFQKVLVMAYHEGCGSERL